MYLVCLGKKKRMNKMYHMVVGGEHNSLRLRWKKKGI